MIRDFFVIHCNCNTNNTKENFTDKYSKNYTILYKKLLLQFKGASFYLSLIHLLRHSIHKLQQNEPNQPHKDSPYFFFQNESLRYWPTCNPDELFLGTAKHSFSQPPLLIEHGWLWSMVCTVPLNTFTPYRRFVCGSRTRTSSSSPVSLCSLIMASSLQSVMYIQSNYKVMCIYYGIPYCVHSHTLHFSEIKRNYT